MSLENFKVGINSPQFLNNCPVFERFLSRFIFQPARFFWDIALNVGLYLMFLTCFGYFLYN
jgi:hypothetical protein